MPPVMQATARAHVRTPADPDDAAKNHDLTVDQPRRPAHRAFSARDVFSIDLYLADVATGRIVRKLVDTALDSHFTSLQFIGSAGSWSPNSRQFAIAGVRGGKAVLALLDISNGDVVREIEVPEVGEILNPTWSPDHKSIAFSATVGGDSDLFILDLASGTTRRVTSDLFADVQPSWSPDGDRIVFVTDRFTTDAKLLRAGDYRLALYDVATGNITPLSTFAEGKNINPQWSSDNRRVFFVSDRSGISNVYAVDTSSGAITQVTDIDSGVSGITALSPAISSAMDAKMLALSAYEESGYHIYLIEADSLAGKPVASNVERLQASTLPPAARRSTVASMLSDATTASRRRRQVEPYARVKLDAVSQPYVTAGVDRFGARSAAASRSSSATCSAITIYAPGERRHVWHRRPGCSRTPGRPCSTNTTKRWNWGVGVEQTPYIAGGYQPGRRRERTAGGRRAAHHSAADQPGRDRCDGVSVQHDHATRARRQLHADIVRTEY
jgi:Tol biopolymer transport system component